MRGLGVFLLACAAFAQSDRGTITGLVTDATGGAIPNATVTAVNNATGVKFTTATNAAGNYSIQQVPVGNYDITTQAAGFRTAVRKGVDINIAQTATINLTLEIGQVEQTMEVQASAPLVESSTSDVGTVITRQQVIDLPLAVSGNMRNPESFIFLTPGVTGDTGNTQINGSQSRAKEVLVDGIGSTSPESGGLLFTYPSVEALSEFKLVGSNFAAEYGRTGGGFEVFNTRSGTNEFHGSAFDYLRNNVFDARGFYAPTTPVNRQNEFGAALGGPVWIPNVYNGKNRTFFYFVYSGFRYRAGATNALLTLPTPAFKQGDFSKLTDRNGNVVQIYDPATTRIVNGAAVRDPFPGNIIPQSRFSAVSSNILPLIPDPNLPGQSNNFTSVGAQQLNRDQYDIKIDHSFSDKNRISGFAYIGSQHTIGPLQIDLALTNALNESRPSRWVRINDDYIISPTTLNHFSAGFTREPQIWSKLSANQDWPQKIGLTGVNLGPGNAFPRIQFSTGFANFADEVKTVGAQVNNVFEYSDTLSHVRGKHSLKFGVDARWLQTNGADKANSQGTFVFNPLETALPSNRNASGNAFASFLLGAVDNANYKQLLVVPGLRYRYIAGFAQDDWKATGKLTLNYGLRYEIYFPRMEAHNNFSSFDPALPNPAAGNLLGAVAYLGSGPGRNGRSSFADTDFKNFGPRLGFAYAVTPGTVLRGGYGVYYAPGNADAGLRASQNFLYGFNPSPTFATPDNGVTPAFNWDGGFPTNYPPPAIGPSVQNGSSVNYVGRNDGRPPYFQNWSVGIQRELPGNMLVEADYVGIKGTHLGNNLIDVNQVDPRYLSLGNLLTQPANSAAAQAAGIALPYPGFSGSVAQALRPYPQYLSIPDVADPNGNSTYHALQTKVEKRFSHGLSFLVAYTRSKTISDSDIEAGGGPAGQTYYNRKLEKTISTNDVPNIFAASVVYDLPFGRGKRLLSQGIMGVIAGGWTVTGIEQYQTGRPIALSANNTLPIFSSGLRPDAVVGQKKQLTYSRFDPAVDNWINPAASALPAPFRLGTAARYYTDLRAPNFQNENVGLIKRTPLTERVTLTFRAEFFNLLNRVVFAAPDGNISNATFGKISRQSNNPRQGQVALRLEF